MTLPQRTPLSKIWVEILSRRPVVARLSKHIRERNLTFLSRRKLRRIAQAMHVAGQSKSRGVYLEAGVALGGTAIFISRFMPKGSELHLYDVFGLIPPPGANDSKDAFERYDVISSGQSAGLGGDVYYGYKDDLISVVKSNMKSFGIDPDSGTVRFVEGVFEETMQFDHPVEFAHIDCDWYASVVTCIERIWPHLVIGGVMLFDDYRSYEGCRKAVNSFLAERQDYEVLFSDVSFAVRRTR